jgi:hypothetical protein
MVPAPNWRPRSTQPRRVAEARNGPHGAVVAELLAILERAAPGKTVLHP